MPLGYASLVDTPMVTTIHGFSSPKILPVYRRYPNANFVSISDSDRDPELRYRATVYNGIDTSLYPFQAEAGADLAFLGRIHPDKGLHLALEVARRSGSRLLIGGIIQDQAYFEEQIEPWIDGDRVVYLGALDVAGKNALFARARALLHLNTIPERFGLVLAEANCAGLPVIAMDLGSCGEVLEAGRTGFLVDGVDQAVAALEGLGALDRRHCRARVEERFSIEAMTLGYEKVYHAILG
jgi:glycosyltransferase involved in cell wall biosynthesis